MNSRTFLRIVQEEAGLNSIEQAEQATQIVFDLLHHRITEDEADDVVAQLPKDLADLWEGGKSWFDKLLARIEPHNDFNLKEFIDQVNSRKQELPSSGEKITRAVFYALQSQITPGEARDIAAQLPKDLKAFWEETRPLAHVHAGGLTNEEQRSGTSGKTGELGGELGDLI